MRKTRPQGCWRTRASIAALACLLALALAPAVSADPVVYVTTGGPGAPPYDPPELPAGTSTSVELYMAESWPTPVTSDPSEVCTPDAAGDERCYWDVILEPEGDVTLTGFTLPNPNADVVAGVTSLRARLNGGDYSAGELDPTHLGDLSIASTGTGVVWLRGGTVVDARGERFPLPERVILYVPEPGPHLALAAGAALLALLHAQRRGRAG